MNHQERSAFSLKLLLVIPLFCCILFAGVAYASTLTLPLSLQEIGEEAFYGDASIDEVILPEGIKVIGERAFANSSITTVHLPSSINSIAEHAFENTSVIGTGLSGTYAQKWFEEHGLEYIGMSTSIEDFEWELNGFGVTITGYAGSSPTVIIPSSFEGEIVTGIGAGAFESNSTMSSVVIPNTVETIGKYAFSGTALVSVSIPESVITIDEFAFYQCASLKTVEFSEGLDAINTSAFQACSSLLSVDLPASLSFLGWRAFRDCSSLTHFGYPVGIKEVGGVFLYGCTSLTEVTVPEGVTRLMDFFISNNTSITTINLPSTLKEIGYRSFACGEAGDEGAWETLTLPEGLEIIGEEAFAGSTNLTNIDIPGSVTYIGLRAFEGASGLSTISFHEGLNKIETYAFKDCSSLSSISLPNTVKTLGCAVFENCVSLTTFISSTGWNEVYVPGTLSPLAAQLGGPRGVFAGCTKLTSVTIPEGATCIPSYAFSYAPNLATVNLPSTIEQIGAGAFMEAKQLRTINFPNGLIEIGFGAFKNCSSLKAAELPDSVTTIGCEAFLNCTSLSSIHFPRNWGTVSSPSLYGNSWDVVLFACGSDYNIFGNDDKIVSVEIPDGAMYIPPCAFQNCTGLRSVTVPDSISSIYDKAFDNCSVLPKVYISPNASDLGENIFTGCKALTVWCEYGSEILQYCKENGVDYYYLTPDDVNNPSGTLYEGVSYGLHGYARSSIPVTNVTATIWNSDKTTEVQKISVAPNSTDYDLSVEVNQNLLFGNLALGNYHFSLTATTSLSEEVWADTSFKVVEQPLWVSFSGFNGVDSLIYTASDTITLTGVIRANYTITNVTARIALNGNTVVEASSAPNSKEYDASNISLSAASLQDSDDYVLTIYVTAKGETRTVAECAFGAGSSANAPDYSDEFRDEIIEYVKNARMGIFNPSEEVNQFFENMSFIDKLWMGLSDYTSIATSQIKDWLTDSEYSSYMVQKYESEIADMLNDMYRDGRLGNMKISSTATDAIKKFSSIIKGKASYELQTVEDKIDDIIANYDTFDKQTFAEMKGWKMLKTELDRIGGLYDKIEITELFLNMSSQMMTDYSRDLETLRIISEAYVGDNNTEFVEAIDIVRTEYQMQYGKALKTAYDYLEKGLTKEVTKKITGEIFSLAMKAVKRYAGNAASGASVSSLYSIADTACQLIIKLSGTSALGSNRIDVITQIGTLNGLQRSFNAVRQEIIDSYVGGTKPTDQQIYKLQVTFRCARQELLRLYETMKSTDTANRETYEQLIEEVKQQTMPGVDSLSSGTGGSR